MLLASIALRLSLGLPLGLAPVAPARDTGAAQDERLSALIVTGANNHWWEETVKSLNQMLVESRKFVVQITRDPETTFTYPGEIAKFDVLILDYNAGERWPAQAEKNFIDAVRGGTGVVVVHAANNAFPGWKEYEELVALMWRDGTGHGRFHPFDVAITDRDHPVTRDMYELRGHPDELYHRLVHMHDAPYRVLATAHSSTESGGTGNDEPMAIVTQFGAGRVFHTPLGHVWPESPDQKSSHFDPQFQELVVRGAEWAATGEVTPSKRPANTLTWPEENAGWRLLFDGESKQGWRAYRGDAFPENGWTVADGTLHLAAGGGGGDLVTALAYQDFELDFEWKAAPGANSGVIYRVSEEFPNSWESGPEFQVLDDGAHAELEPVHSAGALYGLYQPEGKHLNPAGAWNRGRIRVVGNRVEHFVNGVQVLACELGSDDWNARVAASKFGAMPGFAKSAKGHIALQDHGNEVWYRNLMLRSFDFDPARKVALFDGQSLAGFGAHLADGAKLEDVWSIADDGVLVCKGQPAGYLRTEGLYDNFVLRLKWRYDPAKGAGNSGVLLRQIGKDEIWPRSIEAQLQSGAAGDFWNIGAFPMQAAADRTEGRNTRRTSTNERPVGEWNEYEITLWQGDCVLRVNGAILNQASDCMEIPGRICLQSEGAEIHFKDVELVRLPARGVQWGEPGSRPTERK